jgi:hypothetical protein
MEGQRSTYLRDSLRTYRNYKALAEKALAQVPDADLHTQLDSPSRSRPGFSPSVTRKVESWCPPSGETKGRRKRPRSN